VINTKRQLLQIFAGVIALPAVEKIDNLLNGIKFTRIKIQEVLGISPFINSALKGKENTSAAYFITQNGAYAYFIESGDATIPIKPTDLSNGIYGLRVSGGHSGYIMNPTDKPVVVTLIPVKGGVRGKLSNDVNRGSQGFIEPNAPIIVPPMQTLCALPTAPYSTGMTTGDLRNAVYEVSLSQLAVPAAAVPAPKK